VNAQPRILQVGEEPPPLNPPGEGRPRQASRLGKAKGKGASAGRFKVINTFADFSLAGLDRAEIAVWLLLWRDTKPDGLARTSQTDLARRAGTSDRTARRAVNSLRRAGLLTVVYQGGLRRGASVYRVHPLGPG
jgi:hypothetical protein